jgi:hypothetical protein
MNAEDSTSTAVDVIPPDLGCVNSVPASDLANIRGLRAVNCLAAKTTSSSRTAVMRSALKGGSNATSASTGTDVLSVGHRCAARLTLQ